jgi:hypothetical protein
MAAPSIEGVKCSETSRQHPARRDANKQAGTVAVGLMVCGSLTNRNVVDPLATAGGTFPLRVAMTGRFLG